MASASLAACWTSCGSRRCAPLAEQAEADLIFDQPAKQRAGLHAGVQQKLRLLPGDCHMLADLAENFLTRDCPLRPFP